MAEAIEPGSRGATWRSLFALDPATTFLNHGSFGACPRTVLDHQTELRRILEADPVHFFLERMDPLLTASRAALSAFVGASPEDVVFVRNATSAVNAVVANLGLVEGDEVVATTHGYNACNNVLRFHAERVGATVRFVELPWPMTTVEAVVETLVAARGPRSRLLLIDHITSPTGLVLPIEPVVRAWEEAGVPVLVDGAHAPGQIPLSLDTLGASWYTGNLHKWVCAPKGAAFLHTRRDHQPETFPAVVSHGWNAPPGARSRYQAMFDWTGTDDPTPWLTVGRALEALPAETGLTWAQIMAHNRALALRGREVMLARLGGVPAAPDAFVGSMVALPLRADEEPPSGHPLYLSPLQSRLYARRGVQVPIIPFPRPPQRVVRISAHVHNRVGDYEVLADALHDEGVWPA